MTEFEPEISIVNTRHVFCIGQSGAQGHPKVWYHIPEDSGWVECGYCDKRFVLAGSQAEQELNKNAGVDEQDPG